MPLALQLLHDDRYGHLIDHFYFEQHVRLREMIPNWARQVRGTVLDSMSLFHGLRQKGIPAHSWI